MLRSCASGTVIVAVGVAILVRSSSSLKIVALLTTNLIRLDRQYRLEGLDSEADMELSFATVVVKLEITESGSHSG